MFSPSSYQSAVFDFIRNGHGDGIVNAVAGSGKTTTLIEGARILHTSSALFVAFNKHIADEITKRLGACGSSMTAKTVHSIGYGCVAKATRKRLVVDERKYSDICKDWYEDHAHMISYELSKSDVIAQLSDLVDMVRLTLCGTSVDAVEATAAKYNVEYDQSLIPGIPMVLRRGEQLAKDGKVDYTDMLWLPAQWDLKPPTFDWLFADEIQDFSDAQLQLVLKCRAKGGRFLWVGDPRQAIMGFAFAGTDSFQRIKDVTGATELPLSICYRCPTSHIELAQKYVPQIEARPDATEGIIRTIKESEIYNSVSEGDLIICRLTAPLVKTCIQLIANKVPARVKGREIGKSLTRVVKKIAEQNGFVYDEFTTFLQQYRDDQFIRLRRKRASDAQFLSLNDKCDGIQVCYDSFGATNVAGLCKEIEDLFSDTRVSITLSTVHRTKGLENERVFIIKPEKLPFAHPKQSLEQRLQEENLVYVALTRAKSELVYVSEDA